MSPDGLVNCAPLVGYEAVRIVWHPGACAIHFRRKNDVGGTTRVFFPGVDPDGSTWNVRGFYLRPSFCSDPRYFHAHVQDDHHLLIDTSDRELVDCVYHVIPVQHDFRVEPAV